MATTTRSTTRKATPAKRTRAATKPGAAPAVPHLSVAERVARGKAAREEVPRSSHAVFEPLGGSRRPGRAARAPGEDARAGAGADPLRPDARLAVHVLSRGRADHGQDLAATPRSGLTVQCCGDAHLSNFGVFASPERKLVFDVNDFDETLPGPWEWDVKRLAVSMLIAARDNGFRAQGPGPDRARHGRRSTAPRWRSSPG